MKNNDIRITCDTNTRIAESNTKNNYIIVAWIKTASIKGTYVKV